MLIADRPPVYFVVRSDWALKAGGDSVQVEAYVARLRARGWDVRVVPFRPSITLPPGSIVHIVNVDRIYDFLISARAARSSHLFASPIHHSLPLVRQMRSSSGAQSPLQRIADLLPEPVREYIGMLARAGTQRSSSMPSVLREAVRNARLLWRPWAAAGRVLDMCDDVFILAPGERVSLKRDTGWSGTNSAQTPNGVDVPLNLPRTEWSKRSATLLVVGRIEVRKRALETAHVALSSGIPVTFIGSPGTDHAYVNRFRSLVNSGPHLTWIEGIARDEVLTMMACHRVLLNPSWVEVQSLVDLEAAMSGCWVVGTPAGHSSDWIGTGYVRAADFNLSQLIRRAQEQTNQGEPPKLNYPYTWDTAVDVIEFAYVRAIGHDHISVNDSAGGGK